MTISLRLDKKTDGKLGVYARLAGKTKSEVVRTWIREHVSAKAYSPTPWDLGKSVFGGEGSGDGNRSTARKRLIREKVHAKKNHR